MERPAAFSLRGIPSDASPAGRLCSATANAGHAPDLAQVAVGPVSAQVPNVNTRRVRNSRRLLPGLTQLVELRFVGGLSLEETATYLV
jgi:hypothetical protein